MDEKELEAWLNTRPRADAILIAQRAALRVWPLWGAAMGQDWARKRDLTCLPILRSSLTSGVARKYPTPEVRAAAARSAAARSSTNAAARSAAAAFRSVDETAAAAAFRSIDETAVYAATAARSAAASASAAATVTATADADRAVALALVTGATFGAPLGSNVGKMIETAIDAALAVTSTIIERDVAILSQGGDLLTAPLRHSDPPVEIWSAEQSALENLARETGSSNSFWRRWYDAAKHGEWLDWELQKAVALLPEEVWERSPAEVEAEIAKIEAEFAAKARSNRHCCRKAA